MSSRPLRFVQAGDFQLHQPLRGLVDVPDHLMEKLIEAPYRATERVFDAALAAEVDFVLLTGNLFDPHRAGPRGLVFLAAQFARLAERGIGIDWATSASPTAATTGRRIGKAHRRPCFRAESVGTSDAIIAPANRSAGSPAAASTNHRPPPRSCPAALRPRRRPVFNRDRAGIASLRSGRFARGPQPLLGVRRPVVGGHDARRIRSAMRCALRGNTTGPRACRMSAHEAAQVSCR